MNNFENYFSMMNPMNNWAKGVNASKIWDFWNDNFRELKKIYDPSSANMNQNFIDLQQKMMKSYSEMIDNFVKTSTEGSEYLSFFKEYTKLFNENLKKIQQFTLETSKTCQEDIVKKCQMLEKQVLTSVEEYKSICKAHKTDESINLHIDYIKNSINNSIANMQDMLKMVNEANLKATNVATDIAKDTYKEMQESFCEIKKDKKTK